MNPDIDIEIIKKSGLFDKDFYTKENPDIAQSGVDPIEHYVLYGHKENRNPTVFFSTKIYKNEYELGGKNPFVHYIENNLGKSYIDKGYMKGFSYEMIETVKERLLKFPFYSEKEYIRMNMDLKNTSKNITEYAITTGLSEGRELISKILISRFLGENNSCSYDINNISIDVKKTIGVFCHSKGNIFIKELAEILVDYFKKAEFDVKLCFETEKELPDIIVFVAPHEFFYLSGTEHLNKEEIIKKSIMFNTEQPQTLWFTRGLIHLLACNGIIDISYQNTLAFNESGINSFHFDPIPKLEIVNLSEDEKEHNLFKSVNKYAYSDPYKDIEHRIYDVSFFGNCSYKRDKFFSRNSKFFSDLDCFLYYRKTEGILPSSAFTTVPKLVSQNSKIYLNIHRDENNFFEWHRIVLQGMASGSVVITDECLEHPLYKSGTHYLTESVRHIPDLIKWCLFTPEGIDKLKEIQENCFELFKNLTLENSKINDIKQYIGDQS